MALVKCPDCEKEFSDLAAACPNCGRPHRVPAPAVPKQKTSFAAWGCLTIIILMVIGVATSQTASDHSSPSSISGSAVTTGDASSATIDEPKLELESWNWHTEYDYAIAEGRVKNISNESLRSIEAVVTFSTKSGEFITTGDALIDLNPILPGQTSSFKVMHTENPAMAGASVEFKTLFGGTVGWRERNKKGK